MHHPNQESAISGPINLLKHYSFESNGYPYEKVLDSWLERFPLSWVNLALVESLHQGRYKVISVEQILTLWQRRGKPSYHFNHDFERLVSNNLPQTFEKTVSSPLRKTNPRLQKKMSRLIPGQQQSKSSPISQSPGPGIQAKLTRYDSLPPPSLYPVSPTTIPSQSETLGEQANSESRSPKIEAVETKPLPSTALPLDQEKLLANTAESKIESARPSDASPIEKIAPTAVDPVSQASSEKDSTSQASVPFSPTSDDSFNPIHQFVPQSAPSDIHSKLTAMAQINV